MYIVETMNTNICHNLIFDKKFNRVFGFVLQYAQEIGIKFQIKYFRPYTRLVEVDFETPMKELYNSGLSEKKCKDIANKTIGVLEKTVNKKNISKVFDTYEEAQSYQLKFAELGYKSKIQIIDHTIETKIEKIHKTLGNIILDGFGFDFVEEEKTVTEEEIITEEKNIYLLEIYKERKLSEGLRQIKEMVYCLMKIKLYKLVKQCQEYKLNIVGVKTDAVLVDNMSYEITEHPFNWNNNEYGYKCIGGYKLEVNKSCIDKEIKQDNNVLYNIKKYNVDKIDIKDEYDYNEFKTAFEDNKTLLIKSELPGCGKTTAIKQFLTKDDLIACPFNELALEFKKEEICNVTTMHKLFGLSGSVDNKNKVKKYDVEGVKTICIDEVFLNNKYILKKLDQFIKEHPNIKILASGDILQNDPIGDIDDDGEDYNDYINQIFPKQITLKINKRLRTKKERKLLIKIKEEIFNKDISLMETLEKYFKVITDMKDVKTLYNITYSNNMADKVNRHIYKQQKFKGEYITLENIKYYVGMKVICKKRTLYGVNKKLVVNNIYRIESLSEKKIIIVDDFEETRFEILPSTLVKKFKLPYCRTGHSIQGKTIKDKVTIFEMDSPYISRKWAWTAITRCTDFNNIQLFKMKDSQIEALESARGELFLNIKINGYKKQDRAAGRTIKEENYITPEWFMDELEKGSECSICKTGLYTVIEDGNVISNMTADRKNNNEAHHINNCVLSCHSCNCRRSDKNIILQL